MLKGHRAVGSQETAWVGGGKKEKVWGWCLWAFMAVQMSCYRITWQLLLSIWDCVTWPIFVYSRGSEHRSTPVAGGMGGISGGSATTGHMHVLQGSHTASKWDLLAESRANATLNSQSLQDRATSWAPWRSWGRQTASVLSQVRQRWLWNRAGQHCHQNIELDTLQGPHSAFKEGFDWAA